MFLVSRQPWGLACSRMATATPTSTPTTRGSGYSNNNYYDDDKNGSIRDAGQSGDRTVGTRARAMAWAAAHEGRLRPCVACACTEVDTHATRCPHVKSCLNT